MGVSKTSVGEAARYRYFGGAMKRKELARELARRHHVPVAEARDRVDEAVYDILKKLKEGKPVSLPGIGKLVAKPARTTK